MKEENLTTMSKGQSGAGRGVARLGWRREGSRGLAALLAARRPEYVLRTTLCRRPKRVTRSGEPRLARTRRARRAESTFHVTGCDFSVR